MGISFSTHYCMGRAVDSELMVGAHELSCGMMDSDLSCEVSGANIMAPGCCDNVSVTVDIEDEYQIARTDFILEVKFLFAFTYTFLLNQLQDSEPLVAYVDDHPPPLEQDYQSLYQSFLL